MTAQPRVAVLDYGIGNLHSARKALEVMGADARLTVDPRVVAAADGVVLPGVGAFGACMNALREVGLDISSSSIDDGWILDVTNKGSLKLASVELPREQWVRDVGEINFP